MARSRATTTPKSNKQSAGVATTHIPRIGLFAFLAAFAGILAAVPLTIALMMPMVQKQLASEVAGLNTNRTATMTAADDTLGCTQPSPVTASAALTTPTAAGGQVLGASTSSNGPQPGSNSTTTVYVKKLIGGNLTSTGTITNTGPGSNNAVTTNQTETTTVTNNNNLSVTNTNDQHAYSGDAVTAANTTGGSATSGAATNTNDTSFNFAVSN